MCPLMLYEVLLHKIKNKLGVNNVSIHRNCNQNQLINECSKTWKKHRVSESWIHGVI